MLQRHELEIHRLHRRPHHPVLLECLGVRARQLLRRVRPLHQRHRRQEAEEVRRGEDGLVRQDARADGQVRARGEVDPPREEGEPGCCGGAEDCCCRGGGGGLVWVGFGFWGRGLGKGVEEEEEEGGGQKVTAAV